MNKLLLNIIIGSLYVNIIGTLYTMAKLTSFEYRQHITQSHFILFCIGYVLFNSTIWFAISKKANQLNSTFGDLFELSKMLYWIVSILVLAILFIFIFFYFLFMNFHDMTL